MTALGALASNATIPDAGLASPNNVSYKTLIASSGRFTTAGAVSTTYLCIPGSADQTAVAVNGAQAASFYCINFAHADFDVAGLTTVMRLRVTVGIGATAPAQSLTFGLYPLTISTTTITPGTVVTGSTVTLTTPGSSAYTSGVTSDFTIPSDGVLAVCYTLTGTPSGNGTIFYRLQVRNT